MIVSPYVNAENRKLQETSRRFCETLMSAICLFFKCEEMSLRTALTAVKTVLVLLEYILTFFVNKALPDSNSVDWQNVMGKSVKDD